MREQSAVSNPSIAQLRTLSLSQDGPDPVQIAGIESGTSKASSRLRIQVPTTSESAAIFEPRRSERLARAPLNPTIPSATIVEPSPTASLPPANFSPIVTSTATVGPFHVAPLPPAPLSPIASTSDNRASNLLDPGHLQTQTRGSLSASSDSSDDEPILLRPRSVHNLRLANLEADPDLRIPEAVGEFFTLILSVGGQLYVF